MPLLLSAIRRLHLLAVIVSRISGCWETVVLNAIVWQRAMERAASITLASAVLTRPVR